MAATTVTTASALHARPLDHLVRLARRYTAEIRLDYRGRQADAKNVVQLLLLAVPAGAEVTLSVEGPDARAALAALARLLERPGPTPVPLEPSGPADCPLVLQGIAGAPGVGTGVAHYLDAPETSRSEPRSVDEERAALQLALESAARATAALVDADDPFCDIFAAQQSLLTDPELARNLCAAVDAGASVAAAVREVFDDLQRRFDALGSRFAAERHADVADVRDRLLQALGSAPAALASWAGAAPCVLVLAEATPSRMATFDRRRVAAVISQRGGPTSHTAIVARGRGIPLVFAESTLVAHMPPGQPLRVDGARGTIELLAELPASINLASESRATAAVPPEAARSRDGATITLRANLGAPGELAWARQVGSQGCGLLRTELLFAGRSTAPSLEEQAAAYRRIALSLAPAPVVVRLFDAGSDKPLAFLPAPSVELNPALGLRGIRLLLRHPEVLVTQLQAVQLARESTGADLRVLVPMVTEASELWRVQKLAAPSLPVGVMIETPAAAILCRSLARYASFCSIGTNDLVQYVVAADRSAGVLSLHPAALRLIAQVVEACQQAQLECSVCGELAGEVPLALLLVGLGLRVLSLAPARTTAIRLALAEHETSELSAVAAQALQLEDAEALSELLQASNLREVKSS